MNSEKEFAIKNEKETYPKVSIIMPTYNRAALIGETIQSVCAQTYQHWELIIVDDGSEDDTEKTIREQKDERILFLKAGRIARNGKIKNMGIKEANGELIAFIDSDDLWHCTKLEKQVAAIKQHSDAGFSLTGGFNFHNINQPVDFFYRQRTGILCDDILIPFFQSKISATTPSLLFRRKCMEQIGLLDEMKPFSDIDFILKLASRFKAVILYEPLLYRRLHQFNDSNENWIKGYEQGIAMIRSYKRNLPRSIADDAFFRLYIRFGEDCITHQKAGKAFSNFFKAWRNKPFSVVPFKKTGKLILHQFNLNF